MRPKQINLQVDDDLLEDIEVMATRYTGGNKSEFIRRTIEERLDLEAQMMVI